MSTGKLYFWTATLHNWQRLLEDNSAKQIILDSLSHLTVKGKICVYAFVIMPNHIHLIWQIHENNGKETSQASFLKFTAHAFKRLLRDKPEILSQYKVDAGNKQSHVLQALRQQAAWMVLSATAAINDSVSRPSLIDWSAMRGSACITA